MSAANNTQTGSDSITCFQYTVKKGDCLSVLAQTYGTNVTTLCQINNISNPDFIKEGQTLYIPYKQKQ